MIDLCRAKTLGARTFGTLADYSTIWLARALPAGGRLITLEANPEYAAVAAASIAAAGLGEVVEIRVGPALDQLPQLGAEGVGPFDLTFIDADKVHTPDYFAWALEHSRPGSLIIADNVIATAASPTSPTMTQRSPPSAVFTSSWPPSHGSKRRRSRRLAARATTVSP